jgi:hypothetical protein
VLDPKLRKREGSGAAPLRPAALGPTLAAQPGLVLADDHLIEAPLFGGEEGKI